jgi:DNA mismatch repair protein MutS
MAKSMSEQNISAIDAAALTPAMRQYQTYKAQYPDSILFFRIGDFYETFYEDARTISRVLGVALTSRSKGENAVPMAGVPHHAVETYLHRMIAAGYRVAICEQMEDPRQAKGLIDRQVTRLLTPGTLTEDAMLDGREENFLAALVPLSTGGTNPGKSDPSGALSDDAPGPSDPAAADSPPTDSSGLAALAWCELSTGKFMTMLDTFSACREELARIRPREMLCDELPDHRAPDWAANLQDMLKLTLTARPAWQFQQHHAGEALRGHYGVRHFAAFGYENPCDPALWAAGALVSYLHETQKAALEHLQPPRPFERGRHLVIDPTSLRSLEVLRSLRNNTLEGSLIWALDRTRTPMGSRLLRNWLLFPLRDRKAIEERLSIVTELLSAEAALDQVRLIASDCGDMERIAARLCCRRATPRDLIALARSLDTLPAILRILAAAPARPALFDKLAESAPPAGEIAGHIRAAIAEDPPAHLRDGGVIRSGYHAELDRLRSLAHNSRSWLADYQASLVQSTGIHSLKVGYNKIFGYYIEVTHAHAEKIPPEFIRRQTVKNAERYVTDRLKQFESEMLTAQERSRALEQDLYEQLRQDLAGRVRTLQQIARRMAALDVYCSIAHLARTRRCCRPEITTARELKILDARHPVVEQVLEDKFVPNDIVFEAGGPTLELITGPNMAGKSTYIRQAALLVLMAQAGFYLPARQAAVGLVDRIFTRVGASDDLAAGQSTFMVEMTETANILLHASADSLVILDEVGRGTSTLDGLALAWAIAEYLADTSRCRALFATHYHELTELAETTSAVVNCNVLVREWEDQILFMHRIVPGRADRSYGVQVARLAGVPRSVIQRARRLMEQLSVHVGKIRPRAAATAAAAQSNLFDPVQSQVLAQLQSFDPDRMSPMQAWEALKMLQGMLTENPSERV